MSRARISALVLVNWKGVFYERYLLDRHVTALEGANGAGKTTVMIAAYVALLPDMSKLRFTNLGETAATGGDRGIWGRLGESGRPSYTVLELDVAGERVLAGVRLVRLAEPTVEPTAFAITGLPADVRLSDLLLLRQLDGDHVPELDDIKSAVRAAGGELETFRAIKDYFAYLFERGITPMRLASDEERSKLNEMLRTSMTGGISRALTSELRGFLLKEETGLAETLTRMRANLEACARTRSEVSESRSLEREISAIYEAGTDMFAAAMHAARAAASEAERDVELARPLVDEAVRVQRELADAIAAHDARGVELADRLAQGRAELAAAIAERDRAATAAQIGTRLTALDAELAVLAEAEASARARHVAATAERVAARGERLRATEAYDRAAHGLADLQAGLDELVRRAHGHRTLVRRLDDARRATGRPALTADDAAAAIAIVDEERARLDAEHATLVRDGRDVVERRVDHAEAVSALAAIETAIGAMPGDVLARARATLAQLADREAQLARSGELQHERGEADRLAVRQLAARRLADTLALGDRDVIAELEAIEVETRAQSDAADARRDEEIAARTRDAELRARLAGLDDRIARWHVAGKSASRLAAAGPVPASHADVAALRDRLALELHTLAADRTKLEASRGELQQRAASVERSGTNVDPELLRLRDELGGELLATRFEDLDVEAASWVEARLGPLASALIVDDLDAAATAVLRSERSAQSVWLVAAGSALVVEPPADAAELGDDVVSVEPFGLRITRRVPRPSLGRRARERVVRELHDAIARAGEQLDELVARTALVAAWRREVDILDANFAALVAGDPADERAAIATELAELDSAARTREVAARTAQIAATAARARESGLRRLLPDVALLAPPDFAVRAAELAARHAALASQRDELVALAPARATLATRIDVLRQPPPDDDALDELAARRAELAARLAELASARASRSKTCSPIATPRRSPTPRPLSTRVRGSRLLSKRNTQMRARPRSPPLRPKRPSRPRGKSRRAPRKSPTLRVSAPWLIAIAPQRSSRVWARSRRHDRAISRRSRCASPSSTPRCTRSSPSAHSPASATSAPESPLPMHAASSSRRATRVVRRSLHGRSYASSRSARACRKAARVRTGRASSSSPMRGASASCSAIASRARVVATSSPSRSAIRSSTAPAISRRGG